MTVTQAPATYNFSGNLPDLIVSTTDPLDFTLSQAGKTIVSENYHPSSDGRVVINLRNILEHLVESPGIDQPSFAIPYYTYTVGELSGSFYCVRGGHGAAVSAEAFLKGNFLTWQPQTRRTLYHTPHRLRYAALNVCECKVKGYFADGTSETATLFLGTTADTIYTFDVSFGTVRGKFDAQPTYYDIWMEDASGKALTWTQRYMLVDYLPGTNDYFTFENSLGGFDTIRFSGDRKEINKLESVNAEFNEETIEYDIDRTRSWKKYTGYITDEQTRMWVLDFFNSNNRYHLCDGVFRRIYVSEPKVEDVAGEAAGYEFTYAYSRQSKYINIPRVETPELLEITDPSAEVFFLAPRLNQFQAADPDASEILIPVQTPASGKWLALALSTLIGKVGGGSGPTDEYLLKKVWNEAFSLETAEGERILKALLPVVARLMYVENLLAERADVTDLTASDVDAGSVRADSGDIASLTSENIETAILKVLDKIIAKDQTLSGKISSADFLSGLLGYGWLIDSAGRAEMRSLTLWEWLDVPELRYNRVQVIGSEMWVTEGGAISDVQSSGSQCVVTLKLEEGDLNPFRPADILKGIYHTGTGFQTVMLRVDAVSDDGAMTVTPRYPQLLPQKFMDVARIGNFTDKERQRSILISSKEGRILILGDVDGWDIQPRMVKMIFGDTSGFIHPEFGDMSGYNAFLENILMTGRIYQKSADGQTLKPVPVNKGAWEPGSYYYYDEVTRNGCLWLCTADSTTAEPAEGSPDWIKRVDKGADGAKGDKGDKGDQGLRGLQGEKGDRGIQGEKGADGLTSYFHIKYSPVENPTAAQMTEEPDVYIGTYVDYTPADSDDPSKYAWMRFQGLQGDAGEKGIPGVNGADGKTSFLHIKYSDDGQTFTANNGETPGAWIGQYTDFTEADSSVFSRYAWTKIKGDKGDKGDPGKDGIQGTPGAILRSRGVWKPSEVYIRSAEFIDWVVYGAQKYRYVVKSGVATVPAGILPTNTAYWTAFNEMEPVAAPMFLGETASFDVVGSQAIRVLEDDSSEYGWMLTGGKILHTRTGLALNASGKIEAPDGLTIEMSGKSLEEWTQQKADAAKQAAIDAAAADAADKVNAVRIGGVNILNGTKNFSDHWSGEGQILSEQYLGLNVVYCKVPTSADYAEVRQQVNVPFTPSEEYTLSFWAKGEGYVHTYCHPVISQRIIATNGDASVGSAVDTRMRYVLTSEWKRFFVTFLTLGTVSPSGDNRVLFRIHSGNNEVYLCGVKLEQGNKATAYSISDNDQKEYSDKALDALADIASDDKLTPGEKQDAKREWDIIQGEKPILTAQADTIQLNTADYLNVYNALSAYITPLLADMTTTSTITGSVFNARFKTYYDAKTTLLKNIQYYSSGQFRITTIDATELDPDTYYPVTFTLYNATEYKATIEIGAVLGTSGTPSWATHAQGFSCNCVWESNGNRWGTIPVKRYIHSFAFNFTEGTPVGSIGQVQPTSMEYIYVRGGGRYTVRTSGVPFIELHPSGYHWTSGSSSGNVPTRTSVETPVVDVDAAQESADRANAMLADIASDDKLTPSEKQETKREWEIIQGEKPILTAQAKPTLTDTTAYLDAYNALNAYITPLLADMTTTSTITGSEFCSKFKDYYNAKAKLLNNIQYYASGQFQIVTIDATALDPDTYYPVTFNLWNASDSKAAIEISAILSDSGTPPWATHAQGFSCSCVWETNGNRWGAMGIKRYVRSFDFRFSDVTPIGSIGQVYQSSVEYIYVRGGGRYKVRATYCEGIMLRPTGYSYGDVASIGLLTSVETPVVDVEAAKTTAQSALGAANALSTTVTGLKNFTDSAFADGVVTRSEAAAIGKLTNQVAETAESVKAQYYNRYNHADLNETGKRNLAAKYALFDAAKAALLTSITTAIADGIATAAEQADVDTKHNAFNSALSDLNVAFGVADEAIRDAIRAYADSAVDTGQNAVAKNIGFSSYEDMTAKAEAGQTIVKGGRINADLIETATLIAENLITKPASDSDQRRIEIRRETNALTAYDSAGNTVLLVKGDTVDDVNTLINPAAVSLSSDFTPRSFSWSATSELEKYESAVCAELAVTSAGFYEISIPDIQAEHRTQCAAGAYSYGRMDFVLTTSDASDVLVQIPVAKGNTENWNTHVRAGTYTVYAKSRLYLRVRFYGRLEGYASAQAAESMNVKLYTASQKVTCTGSTGSAMRTSLFANGMAATYSNQEYFVVFKGGAGIPYIMGRGDTRLLSKSGKYGLRLTDSGVLATSNSTNDNNWGALMHGLVAWGVVNTGTGTIAKYWTSPAGNITSLTAAAGGTGYVTITMFGSGFTSTSSYAVDAKPNNTDDRIVYASVQNKKTTSFKIGTGDGAGSVATDVVFFIFNLDTYKY